MKRYIRYGAAAVLCAFLPVMTAGCSDIAADTASQAALQMEVDTAETTLEAEAVTDALTQTAAVESTAQAETAAETTAQEAVVTVTANETIGSTGLTADQWCTKAQSIYENAASIAFSYFGSTAGCVLDEGDVVNDVWYRVTNFNTIEDATAAYFAVFSKAVHGNDFSDKFQMIDDKLYCCLGDRGSDISYVSSQITALTASTDTVLSFTVTSTYQFPDDTEITTQEHPFTLVYENDQWMVGEFTLPY